MFHFEDKDIDFCEELSLIFGDSGDKLFSKSPALSEIEIASILSTLSDNDSDPFVDVSVIYNGIL